MKVPWFLQLSLENINVYAGVAYKKRKGEEREGGGVGGKERVFCCCCCFIFVFCLFVCLFVCHYHDSGYRRVTKPFFILVLVCVFPLIILLDRKVTSQELSYTYHEIVSNLKRKEKRNTESHVWGEGGREPQRERERDTDDLFI